MPVVVCTRLQGQGERLALAVRALLQVLAEHWASFLPEHPLPGLYARHIRYQREPEAGSGQEEFADPWTVLARGWGDCDDLIGYRVSELLAQGEAATVNCIWDGVRMHVRVRRASGDLEDPAQILHERNP